jgi:hypothetical protein
MGSRPDSEAGKVMPGPITPGTHPCLCSSSSIVTVTLVTRVPRQAVCREGGCPAHTEVVTMARGLGSSVVT